MITVELKGGQDSSTAEVAICFDDQGLDLLIEKLSRLRGKKNHMHLMTPTWAGDELSEHKQGNDEYKLLNHLRLVKL